MRKPYTRRVRAHGPAGTPRWRDATGIEPARLQLARLRRLHPSAAARDGVRTPGDLTSLSGLPESPGAKFRRAQRALSEFQDEDLDSLGFISAPRDSQD